MGIRHPDLDITLVLLTFQPRWPPPNPQPATGLIMGLQFAGQTAVPQEEGPSWLCVGAQHLPAQGGP